jgi:hypothetical protein
MSRILVLAVLLTAAHAADKEYPLVAVAGIGRGEFPGTYTTELRIGRTIYVSPDLCKAELAWNGRYPARMNSRTIWVLVGSRSCKFHVTDEHPYMSHRSRPEDNEEK